MSFNWGLYLDLALALQVMGAGGGAAEEAAYRACTSKAYYSLYNQAVAQYISVFRMDPKAHGRTTHKALVAAFQAKAGHLHPSSRNRAVAAVSQYLDRARELRTCADYHDDLPMEPKDVAKEALHHVQAGIAALPNIVP